MPEPALPGIREAGRADVEELARLRWQLTDEEGDVRQQLDAFRPQFAGAFDRFSAPGSWTVLVAEGGGGLIGLWLKRIERVPRPNRDAVTMGYVTNVYVETASRNRGIGSPAGGSPRDCRA